MANTVATQTLVDGPRNLVVKVTGILDTSDLTGQVVVDPTGGQFPVSRVRLDKLQFAIEDGLTCNLYWDATTPVLIDTLNGRGEVEADPRWGGQINNAGPGRTGKITLDTEGWQAGSVLSFNFIFECVKQPQ